MAASAWRTVASRERRTSRQRAACSAPPPLRVQQRRNKQRPAQRYTWWHTRERHTHRSCAGTRDWGVRVFLHRQAGLCWRGQGVRCTLATNMMHRPEDTLRKIRAHRPGDLQSCAQPCRRVHVGSSPPRHRIRYSHPPKHAGACLAPSTASYSQRRVPPSAASSPVFPTTYASHAVT